MKNKSFRVVLLFLLLLSSYSSKACLCSSAPPASVVAGYSNYDGGILSNTVFFQNALAPFKNTFVHTGQLVYYQASPACYLSCGSNPGFVVSGGTIVESNPGGTIIGVLWDTPGTGTIDATNYTSYGLGTLQVVINDCTPGNIGGVYASYDIGTGILSDPVINTSMIQAGEVFFYRASSKDFDASMAPFEFLVEHGTLLQTYTDAAGYKVAKVEWSGTAGTGSIRASAVGLCPSVKEVTIVTPEVWFDGDDDRITIPHHTSYDVGTGDFTVETWIKADAVQNSTYATILSKRSTDTEGIWFGIDDNGKLVLHAPNVTQFVYNTGDLRNDVWHHVAVTKSSSIISFYIDGESGGVAYLMPAVSLSSTQDIWVGNDYAESDRAFTGFMKGLRFWKKALSSAEIKSTWKMNLNAFYDQANLIGCWDMHDFEGQVQTDQSDLANDGYLGSSAGTSDAQDPLLLTSAHPPFVINALYFSKEGQQVRISHNSKFNIGSGNYTIEVFIKPQNTAQNKNVFSKGDLRLYLSDTEVPVLEIQGNPIITSSGGGLSDNAWHHLAITQSGTTITLYVNGVAQGTAVYAATYSSISEVLLGGENDGYVGLLDEFRIWNKARTSAQLVGDKQAKTLADLSETYALMGWWRFNAASGQTDKDYSNGGIVATLGNQDWADPKDPLRIADEAFPGARKGFVPLPPVSAPDLDLLKVSAYPNPFGYTTTLAIEGLLVAEEIEVEVYELSGRLVYRMIFSYGLSELVLGESWPAGMYVVRVRASDVVQTLKVSKQ
jgi:hypothetical protein